MVQSLPHRWSLDHNPLSGITARRWWKLLVENRFDVDAQYAHRAVFISVLSLFNSACAAWENIRHRKAITQAYVRKDPIFIMGHWRSGTTHLHNLLSLDDGLTAPTTFQCVNPLSFLSTATILPAVFKPFLPPRRPMDEMEMGFDLPQEDELALSLISGMSPYVGLSFPRRAELYNRFLTFAEASDDEVAKWKAAFIFFAQKLAVNEPRPVVYKSPGHTARIKLLLELFPDARFVHIHRDPFIIFQSSRHYFQTAAWYANLQRFEPQMIDEAILRRYQDLYDAYLTQRDLIPSGRLHELSFASLISDPLVELKRIYAELQIDWSTNLEPKWTSYLQHVAGHQTNRHAALNDDERSLVASRWHKFFDAFGYSPGDIKASENVARTDHRREVAL